MSNLPSRISPRRMPIWLQPARPSSRQLNLTAQGGFESLALEDPVLASVDLLHGGFQPGATDLRRRPSSGPISISRKGVQDQLRRRISQSCDQCFLRCRQGVGRTATLCATRRIDPPVTCSLAEKPISSLKQRLTAGCPRRRNFVANGANTIRDPGQLSIQVRLLRLTAAVCALSGARWRLCRKGRRAAHSDDRVMRFPASKTRKRTIRHGGPAMRRVWRLVAWVAGIAVMHRAHRRHFSRRASLNKPDDNKTAQGKGKGKGRGKHGGARRANPGPHR